MNSKLILPFTVLLGLCALTARAADQPASPEARMRDMLRNTMLQLRNVTAERDALAADKADLDSQNKALQAQVKTLTQQSIKDRDAADKTIAVLKTRTSEQETAIAGLQKAILDWKAYGKKQVDLLNATEAKRAKLAADDIRLQRIVDDQKMKNDAMYKIGTEVLDRYEKFGLGQALFAKEPFTGIMRTKFQNLVQDYSDKLVDARIKQ